MRACRAYILHVKYAHPHAIRATRDIVVSRSKRAYTGLGAGESALIAVQGGATSRRRVAAALNVGKGPQEESRYETPQGPFTKVQLRTTNVRSDCYGATYLLRGFCQLFLKAVTRRLRYKKTRYAFWLPFF